MIMWGGPALAQIVNFKPLERGDYEEEEEKLIILRGLEVSADYAIRIARELCGTRIGHAKSDIGILARASHRWRSIPEEIGTEIAHIECIDNTVSIGVTVGQRYWRRTAKTEELEQVAHIGNVQRTVPIGVTR